MIVNRNYFEMSYYYEEYYSLTEASQDKIFRRVLQKKDFISLSDEKEKVEFFENLLKEISGMEDIETDEEVNICRYSGKTPTRCSIGITVVCKLTKVHSVNFRVGTSDDGRVAIIRNSFLNEISYAVRSAEDIRKLRDAFLVEYEEAEKRRVQKINNEIKRGKLQHIKQQAIKAHIEEFAKEEGFEYIVETMSNKIKLNIRIAKRDYLEINIPYKSFNEVLQHTRKAWHAIKELTEKGVPLKIRGSSYVPNWDWKKHEKEQ